MTFRGIQSLCKPKAAQPVVKRIGQYLAAMRGAGRPVEHITLSRKDYDLILKSVRASKQPHEPEISGLRYDNIRVDRGGA